MTALLIVAAAVGGAVLLVFAVIIALFFNLWLQAKASGVPVTFLEMAMMRLRRINPAMVVGSAVPMYKAGLDVDMLDIQAHVLAGGNLDAVTDALIRADKADLGMDFRTLAAIDLAGRDVLDAVRTHVQPKVISCPSPTSGLRGISGVCKDGIRLSVTARITVRTRLDRLVGGAGEETIIARVGEGIVATIGKAETHKVLLEHPELISQRLLERGLDSGTAFEILSVDVADIDVEENIGARLISERAHSDKMVAQAMAEMRRAAAVAAHTEMRARTCESRSRVVSAKAVVPRAAAAAFLEKNLGCKSRLPATVNNRIRWRSAIE
jgi:uncharacterized protein YqfA (UPF0365 family)